MDEIATLTSWMLDVPTALVSPVTNDNPAVPHPVVVAYAAGP